MTRWRDHFATFSGLVLGFTAGTALGADLSRGALFASDEALTAEISAPWRDLTRKKEEQRWPATMMVENTGGEPLQVALTVERRGISRQRICDFPPIRLRFDKQSVDGTLFDGEGSLKLVTHCDDGERWTQYYVLEMLTYRIHNLVTDFSFRVRPFEMRYRDVDRDKEPDTHFAFVIEDVDELADRHDMEELEPKSTLPGRLEPRAATQLALFQFMIGNLDWSAIRGPGESCCHNVKLIGRESDESEPEAGSQVPVPYDFDVSGLVDAHYAVPPEQLGVRSLRTRLFRGFCQHNDHLPATRAQFLELENAILALVRTEPRLKERNREDAARYLESFFEILRDDGKFEKRVVSECRG